MINVIISENLYHREFVEKYTSGFEKLKERARKFTPEKTAAITGLSAEAVEETARFYAAHQPSNMVIGVASSTAPPTAPGHRAINVLRAIVGSIEMQGAMSSARHARVF
jgi:anaerobic selenocysteine-containing dehydrogenase